MKTTIICVLALAAGICAFGWYINKLISKAFARFIVKKGYTPPTPEELRTCIREELTKRGS